MASSLGRISGALRSTRPAARAWTAAQSSTGTTEKLIMERLNWERNQARTDAGDGFCNFRAAVLRSQLQQLRAANSLSTCAILSKDLHQVVLQDREDSRSSPISAWLLSHRVVLQQASKIVVTVYDDFPFSSIEEEIPQHSVGRQ